MKKSVVALVLSFSLVSGCADYGVDSASSAGDNALLYGALGVLAIVAVKEASHN